jgi:hypothetical protein
MIIKASGQNTVKNATADGISALCGRAQETATPTTHSATTKRIVTLVYHRHAETANINVSCVSDDSYGDEHGQFEHDPWLWSYALSAFVRPVSGLLNNSNARPWLFVGRIFCSGHADDEESYEEGVYVKGRGRKATA